MDRGGLYHVNDNTYHFFYQVELCLREFFNFRRIVSGDLPNCKETIIQSISRSEEVLHTWHIMTDEEDNLLLVDEMYEVLIREFVTLRGFAFATYVVESYKKLSGKNLQKNKGLRKTIPNN